MTLCKKLIITCGGTGGHFFPGLSIAKEFKARGGEVHLIISGKNARAQSEHIKSAGLTCHSVETAPVISKNIFKVIRAVFAQLRGYRQARKIIKDFKPDAVLAMGSFTSFPSVYAAKRLKIPIFLHDGNARIGRANRFFSRWARCLMTAFPAVNAGACACPVKTVGMPVREAMRSALDMDANTAIEKINAIYPHAALKKDTFTFLVFGGSLGAATINKAVPKALNNVRNLPFQVIHLSGPKHLDAVVPYEGIDSLILESAPEMDLMLSASNWVISRAGGSTLAELAVFGRPALLIPFPLASENHQMDNAHFFESHNAGILLPDSEASASRIELIIANLLATPGLISDYHIAMQKLAMPRAIDSIITLLNEGGA